MYRMLAPLFRRFPRTRLAYEHGKHVYYRLRQPDMIATFEDALADIPDAFVVQVGANDGAQGDPIHALFERHPGWSGLLIEPVPFVFERLRANYHNDSRFIYARVAIADEQGSFPFYSFRRRACRARRGQVGGCDQFLFDPATTSCAAIRV